MSDVSIGYIGLDHHHRDPYFQVFDQLPVEIAATSEPNETFDPEGLGVDEERPDTLEADVDVGAIVDSAPFYRDPFELIENEPVDIVWLTLSNEDAPSVIEAAIDKGRHVFSEKPVARTAAELEPVAEKARNSDVLVGTDYFYRTHPVVRDLRELIAEGFFGDIWAFESRLIATQLAHRRTSHYVYQEGPSRGGVLQWIGLHWIDMIMHVLDEWITRVNANMVRRHEGEGVEDSVTLQLETESGVIGTFSTGYYIHQSKDSNFSLYGRDGSATTPIRTRDPSRDVPVPLDLYSGSEEWFGAPHRHVTYDMAFDHPPFGNFGFQFFKQFIEAVEHGGQNPAGIDDIMRVLRVLDAAYESAEQEEWVDVVR